MKVNIERSYLATALGVVRRAVSARNTLPILAHVLLEATDDRLTITATDLDTSIRCTIPAQGMENGSVCLPAGPFNDYVSKLPDAPIIVEALDGKALIRSGKSKFSLFSSPAEDFPVVPDVSQGTEITIPAGTLKDMLKYTAFAASKEESRSLLMGVLFEVRGKWLTMVATDTHRLSLKKVELSQECEPITTIVPAKPLVELERLLKGSEDEMVTLRFGGSQVRFQTKDVSLVSRVLDGQFPNYEKVIPKQSERRASIRLADLSGALQRIYLVATTASNKAIFDFKDHVLGIKAESAEMGKSEEELPISLDGRPLATAYNVKYLTEVLSIVSNADATLSLGLTGPLNPAVMSLKGDDNWTYIVMPMQA